MVCLLLVVPGDELYYGIIVEISSLQEIRVKLSESTVEIALRADVRQATLDAPMLVEQTRAEAYGLLVRIVRACAEVETYIRLCADILGKHIDGGTKSTSTVGRSTYTTLNLHALKV